jgi:hypothetical protein
MAKHKLRLAFFLVCLARASVVPVSAQSIPLTLGPFAVNVPRGWTGEANSVPVRIFSADSTPQSFFSVEFFPPDQTADDLAARHAAIWGRMAGTFRITAPPQNGILGRFIWTRADVPRGLGQRETFILYSAKAGDTYVGVAVRGMRQDLVRRNLPTVEAMLRGAIWSNAVSGPPGAAPASSSPNSGPNGAVANAGSPASLSDYIFAAPAGWTTNQYSDGIVMTSPVSQTGERCLISLWPLRPSAGNLLSDANSAFRDIFRSYELKNQTSGGFLLQPLMVRGTSGQGWDYLMVKRGIAKPGGQYETILGFVMVAKLDNRIAVISGLSKDPLISACMGELTGATVWPKFFYSLGFKSWKSNDAAGAMRRKLAGSWTTATATASDQITFAGNGRYANAAAAQQYYRLSSSELMTTTQAYFGNGTYSLRGNAITLTQDDRKNQPENGFFRLEEESKDEGRTWSEGLYILRTSMVDGKEYEVKYTKR